MFADPHGDNAWVDDWVWRFGGLIAAERAQISA